jgi:hypothetical protein
MAREAGGGKAACPRRGITYILVQFDPTWGLRSKP